MRKRKFQKGDRVRSAVGAPFKMQVFGVVGNDAEKADRVRVIVDGHVQSHLYSDSFWELDDPPLRPLDIVVMRHEVNILRDRVLKQDALVAEASSEITRLRTELASLRAERDELRAKVPVESSKTPCEPCHQCGTAFRYGPSCGGCGNISWMDGDAKGGEPNDTGN